MTYGKKDDDKTSAINGGPVLLPLEYCSIERAARMLRVEVEDIYHWCDIGSIGFYFLFDKSVEVGGTIYPSIDPDYSLTDFIEQHNKESLFIDSDSKWLSATHKSKQSSLSWETSCWGIDGSGGADGPIRFTGLASGLWKLRKPTSKSRLTAVLNMDSGNKGQLAVDIGISTDLSAGRGIYLVRSDLEKLYMAIYDGKILPNKYNSEEIMRQFKEQEAQEGKERKPRTERAQSDMIKALLACLPDLNEELESNPSLAPNIMDSYLIKKDLKPLNLGENNYRNWIAKAQYKP
ncbi:hypothetical protein KW429_10170 [Vibrio fluvialis]|nr:hypothetical protein [Vibrio fluvialis]